MDFDDLDPAKVRLLFEQAMLPVIREMTDDNSTVPLLGLWQVLVSHLHGRKAVDAKSLAAELRKFSEGIPPDEPANQLFGYAVDYCEWLAGGGGEPQKPLRSGELKLVWNRDRKP